MSSEILINSAIGEMRVAHLEYGKVVNIRLLRDHEPSLIGAIFYSRVTALSTEFQAAFVDLGQGVTGFLPLTLLPKCAGRKPKDLTALLNEGQKIIVQVTADATPDKSVKLTGRVEIISASLILHPFREGAFVSSRIKDPSRREALKKFSETLSLHGMGLTLRTESAELSNADIKKTADHLIRHWLCMVGNRKKNKVPFLLSQGPDNLLQTLRDYGSTKHDKIIFDRPDTLRLAQNWAKEFAPDLISRMTLHQDSTPLFEYFLVEEELDKLLDKHIALRSGAWITIEQTEAMIVIDVNMGNATAHKDPAKQRLAVNFDAAKAIFRQIRLRGLSGLIIIDFINMSGESTAGKSDVSNLLAVVDNLILEDPIQIQRSNISSFGLLELARKGRHLPLHRQMLAQTQPIAKIETMALSLLRQAERNAAPKPGIPLMVKTSPQIKQWLEKHPELFDQFTKRTGSILNITVNSKSLTLRS